MDLNEFNDNYVNKLLDNIRENKTTFLIGDFNIDLLKYESHTSTNEFLDSLSSNMILPYILHPTRITGHSKTLIDNIFSNHISKEAICGNLTSTISDHLPQFLIMPSIFSDPSSSKSNVYERSWLNVNKEEFTLDYFEKDWDRILNVEKNGVNHSFDNFLSNMNGLLDKHAPFKKASKYQLKLKTKPWITAAIHKSILVENYLFKKYIKLKDPVKKLKHMINTSTTETYFELIKKSKKKYCNEFFKTNMNNIKNAWKRIRNVISWKQSASACIHLLSQDNETVSNPKKIVNSFND